MLVLPQLAAVPLAGAQSTSIDYSTEVIAERVKDTYSENLIIAGKISKEQAIEIASKFINIPNDYTQQSVNYQSNWYPGSRTVWNINWNKERKNDSFGNISITVDAETGTVISMNRWENDFEQPPAYPPKFNWESARKVAEQFVQQKAPQKANNVKLDDSNETIQKPPLQGNASYRYSFARIENGIPFSGQFINVGVNGNGEVISYEYRWDEDVTIPETKGMLTKLEIEKKIKESLPVELKYQTIRQPSLPPNKQNSMKLAYNARFLYPNIDAMTGNWLEYGGKPVEIKDLAPLKPLSTDMPAEIPQFEKELTQEQAIEIATKRLAIPDDARLENIYYNDGNDYRPFPTWNLNWVKGAKGDEPQLWIRVSINGSTGEIINYSKDDPSRYRPYGDNESFKQAIDYDQAKEKAIKELKKYAPNRLHQLTFDPLNNRQPINVEKMRDFNFTFHRIENGIVIPDQYITISISSETGELFNFYQNWNDQIELPSPNNVIPLEKAREVYFENFTISPKYVYYENINYESPVQREISKPEVKLVYEFRMKSQDGAVYLDALQGKWVSMETGEPIKEMVEAKDIKGHPAEKELQLLIDYNAIDVDENGLVKPDEAITRGEMVKTLMLITNPDPYYYKMNYMSAERSATFKDVQNSSPYFAYVESAVQQGLIDKSKSEFKPNETITREELAVMLVKAMRLDKLAQVPTLFNTNFTDVDKINKKGEAAIVHHLGIMPAVNNEFAPNQKVTRAAGAQAFYQFLQERGKYTR